MAGAADQEQQDTVDVLGTGRRRLELGEVGERQADGAGGEGAGAQEVAPGQAVAELDTLAGLELEHGTSPYNEPAARSGAGFILRAAAADATGKWARP